MNYLKNSVELQMPARSTAQAGQAVPLHSRGDRQATLSLSLKMGICPHWRVYDQLSPELILGTQ